MTIKIESTMIKGRYNLIDDTQQGDDKYLRQLSTNEVHILGMSIIHQIGGEE